MVAVSPRFLLLYGGEGRREGEGSASSSSVEILGDIWVYDLEEMAWTEIETLYGSMTPRYEFTLTLHRNELFIFGGMNE
jgi:N-acetylneuraminic acid mutarotase